MPLEPEVDRMARRLVLGNALAHGGSARAGSILSRLMALRPDLRGSAPQVGSEIAAMIRAYQGLGPADLSNALAELGGPLAEEPRPEKGRAEGVLPDLPGAVPGQVVLRLAPFPSGALHIGNARMLYVNDHYRRRYGGRLLLVFDDTVGSAEKQIAPELFDVIRRDLDIAGVPPDEVLFKSDRLPIVYRWAERVIRAGGAYVCTCPSDRIQELRRAGLACPERAQTTDDTLSEWRRMLSGEFAPGSTVLRLRTDLADPDPAFRDRVLCRISDLDHPRVGRRWKVWPMLEFSWAVDDVELGITHVLRGKDLVIEDRMEAFIWELLGVSGPPFLHWGMLRVAEAKISKSKGFQQVRSGQYDGWADPRLWSIASLDRRGIRSEALRRFTLGFGLSLADIEVPAETLYAENRQLIDATTPRRSFVPDPIEVAIDGFPDDLVSVELANHPDRPEMGRRTVSVGRQMYLPGEDVRRHLGAEVRLKDLVNIVLPAELPTDRPAPARFTSRENRRLPRLQWVGRDGAVPVSILDPDGSRRMGQGEGALRQARPGETLQFERVGFVRLEVDMAPDESPIRVCFGHS